MQKTGQKLTKFTKSVKIVVFHDHFWNHNEKCIQISTNMPGISSLIHEIADKISEMSTILLSKTNARVVSVIIGDIKALRWGGITQISINSLINCT